MALRKDDTQIREAFHIFKKRREKCVAEEQRTLRVKAPGAYLDPRD
ncbi:hypothetical protein D623_10003572 [Myotis brandtii]|uniref:Uncharacterized protein n=1 Tax=Myotis brandtii TaxID=109478 RepID=S7P273_MYOBR|nr:hypothetical protein D623_10003572 [Myotis brandtii]